MGPCHRSGFYFLLSVFCLSFFSPLQARAQLNETDINPNDTSRVYTVFLIGDAGETPLDRPEPNLVLLQRQLKEAGEQSAVVFLGDNIYPKGLPDSGDVYRPLAEQFLINQLKTVKDYPGDIFFIPGNHDWDRSGRSGWRNLQNQEEFVEQYLDRGNTFLPDGGCPGPVEVQLTDELTLIIVDTQWWLHPWDKPGRDSDCDAKTTNELLLELDDIIKRNEDKSIIVASHHPMFSYGSHGGRYTWRQHFFTLTDLNKKLYFPLPIIGSIYPLYRRLFGSQQDIAHPVYRQMTQSLRDVFRQHPNLIHAAGHEHSLQYIAEDGVHYIVSGSGSKRDFVSPGRNSPFALSSRGFARIDYLANGDVFLEFWVPDANRPQGQMVYRHKLKTRPPAPAELPAALTEHLDFTDSTVVTNASDLYRARGFKRFLLGNNYRAEWEQPVRFPVFDIGREKGGMQILQRGGGQQTASLRLEDSTGLQYVLRSVDKNARGLIPENLHRTIANEALQDQMSASNPYGALIIPYMAQAAGIFHTRPRIVYIPDDPRLGRYRSTFANTLALYEERPAKDGTDRPNFGNSEKIISTAKVLSRLEKDNDNRVDQQAVLRARLFDVVIGDWDRHDDQWRWATFEEKIQGEKEGIYRPIPRDRDVVFYLNEGLLPKIASRSWLLPKIQGFDHEVRDMKGFMQNARYFDRSFLNEPSREEWLAIADTLQRLLTDSVLTHAVQQWPEEIRQHSGDRILERLKARRDGLKKSAEEYYEILAKQVDVVGSNKMERFEITRLNNDDTHVKVIKISKKDNLKQTLYERTFKQSETQEIRLYGLGGDDQFIVRGEVDRGIRIRIIGGRGNDLIVDSSNVRRGSGHHTIVYDTRSGNRFQFGPDTRNETEDNPRVHQYNRKGYRTNQGSPLADLQYNADDGLLLSLGAMYRTHSFRREPFASEHRLLGSWATATNSFNFRYNSTITDVLGDLDLVTNLEAREPRFVTNFFGLGNETSYTLNEPGGINFYRYRSRQVHFNTMLAKRMGPFQNFYFGPALQTVRVLPDPGRFLLTENEAIRPEVQDRQSWAGLKLHYEVDKRDAGMMPNEGVVWNVHMDMWKGLPARVEDFAQFSTDLTLYWTLRLPARFTIANRVGFGHNFGDFAFYQGQVIGGNTNLRGFRNARFAGRTALYNNTELRILLFNTRSYLLPARIGVLGFHDVGRVWHDGERSARWHRSIGPGLWIAPLDAIVISAMWGFTREENLPLIKIGFFF
jgi:UDP-2,3-diacylglucosamine pyrophosphatase LpxH